MQRVFGAAFLNDMVCAVDHVMPWASMPVVVAAEQKNSRALDVERDVKVICELIEEMGCVGAFIASPSIVGAAHVGAHSDALPRPLVPGPIGIEPDGNGFRRRSLRERWDAQAER